MSDTNTSTPEIKKETIQLARTALGSVLKRIRDNPDVRYHMGACTQTFEDVKAAHAALTGMSEEEIEENTFIQLTRQSASEKLSRIRDIADSSTNTEMRLIQDICRE